MALWIVPGAPLEHGAGWRIWYSWPAGQAFNPGNVVVSRGGIQELKKQEWNPLPSLPGYDRRMGICIVRLKDTSPGALYDVLIPEAGNQVFRWKSMPDDLSDPEGVSFLLSSCFWRDNDREGAYSVAVRELTRLWKPAFKILCGDQVYQDWPPEIFGDKQPVTLYGDRYADYWSDPAYQEVLTATPNLFLCDDHEYWNDYPETQIHLARSRTEANRRAYGNAAQKLYELFQQHANPGGRAWYSFTINPVSFFVSDARSHRDRFENSPHGFFKEDQWDDLVAWQQGLRGPGVLVIGQPLYQEDGDWRDHSLSNFREDYVRLLGLIESSLRGNNLDGSPHDILILTGDIHTGRFSTATVHGIDTWNEVHELVASPASRVGPYLSTPNPEKPPTRIAVQARQQSLVWDVQMHSDGTTPTIDNNIALIRMFPGTNQRVRFELSLWRIRPYDNRSAFSRLFGKSQPQGPVVRLFPADRPAHEIQLR